MKNLALWLLIVAVLISSAAFGADISRMDAAATMAISDKNGDNRIDREEYNQRMTEVFFFIDTDKDGQLTIAELQQVEIVDPQRFETADRDGNPALSLYEYLCALHKDFEVADKNNDGTLDMEELHLMVGK
jgi:Ca2+-binding EF-hand superfamily protein